MKIGWAVCDITPERPVVLIGQFQPRISTHVNDPLRVTALALEGDGAQAIIMSWDGIYLPEIIMRGVREELGRRLPGFDPQYAVASATHTHTAPQIEVGWFPPAGPGVMTPEEFAAVLIEGMVEAAIQAWEGRAAGGVSWGLGHAVVGHNRRTQYAGGVSRMYGTTNQPDFECMEGFEDHSVDLLFTFGAERELTGVLINLACPSQETEGESYVSADFWHEVRQELWQRHGESLYVLPQCSAAGDQSPHLLLHKASEALMRERRGLSSRQEIGRRIANAVDDVLPLAAADVKEDLPFAHVTATLQLPRRRVTRGDYETARAQYEEHERTEVDPQDHTAVSRRDMMVRRNRRVMERYEGQGAEPTYPAPVHVLRLGDVAMATNPFELFLDYGERLKARSPAVQTFVVQLAEAAPGPYPGYLPTARAIAARSYGAEVVDSTIGPDGGQTLVDRTLELIAGLWDA